MCTEGSQFDPGLNHFLPSIGTTNVAKEATASSDATRQSLVPVVHRIVSETLGISMIIDWARVSLRREAHNPRGNVDLIDASIQPRTLAGELTEQPHHSPRVHTDDRDMLPCIMHIPVICVFDVHTRILRRVVGIGCFDLPRVPDSVALVCLICRQAPLPALFHLLSLVIISLFPALDRELSWSHHW